MNKWAWTLLNLSLAWVLGLLVLLLIAMHTNPDKRNQYWLQGMVSTPAPGDFSADPYFADGQTLQAPPPGTLAQGQAPYPYSGGVEEAIKAGKALKSPLDENDPAVLNRGRIIFERDCMPCHGVEARGDGVVPRHGFPQPPSLLAAHAKGLPDGYIYNYISEGGMLMPSYGAQIAPQDRWKVIAWVRHMQKTFPENAPAPGTPEAEREAQLIPSTTPGYGYDGPPPMDEQLADQALVEAVVENKGEPSPAEAFESAAAASAAAAGPMPTEPWAKAKYLITKNNFDCFTCHAVDHKVVGPAYIDVAKRYKGVAGIVPKLVAKVKAGGSGNWGNVPMVAHPNISNADLTVLVEGVLSLAYKEGKSPWANAAGAAPAAAPAASAAPAPAASSSESSVTWAQAKALIDKNSYNCFTCHAVDHKVIGPAYIQVAQRYEHTPGIVAKLMAKVKAGGSGNWGNIPMVAHPNIPEANLRILVEGILSLAHKGGKAAAAGPQSMAPAGGSAATADAGHKAPSMKEVLAMVHSGRPFHCPALDGGRTVTGPAYLGDPGQSQAQPLVRRVSADELAAVDAAVEAAPDVVAAPKETK